jgi:peroxiredoxin family protein
MPAKSSDLDLLTRLEALEGEVAALKRSAALQQRSDTVCLICFSGEWDRLFAGLTIAGGALAMGQQVHLFFTFWAVNALRRSDIIDYSNKSTSQALLLKMLPAGWGQAKLSKLNYWGLGKKAMKQVMENVGVDDIDTLFRSLKELGVNLHLCETSAALFGIKPADLTEEEHLELCGVATFISYALKSKMVLFI